MKFNIIFDNKIYICKLEDLESKIIGNLGYGNHIKDINSLNVMKLDDEIEDITDSIKSYFPNSLLDVYQTIKFLVINV